MKNPLRKLRISINTFLTFVGILVVAGFVVIRINLIGRVTNSYVSSLLSEYLQTQVYIEEVDATSLNTIAMGPLTLYDLQGDTLLYARRVMASFDLVPLLTRELKVNTIQILDFDIHCTEPDIHSQANFQFIIDALSARPKNDKKLFSAFDVNGIFLRQGRIRFDVLNVRHSPEGVFDIHHVNIGAISANMSLHYSPEKGATFQVHRLSLNEQCGLVVENSRLKFSFEQDRFRLQDVEVNFGESLIHIDAAELANNPLSILQRRRENAWLCDLNGLECAFAPDDLSHLDSRLSTLRNSIALRGELHATSDTIRLPHLVVTDHDSLSFEGQMAVVGQYADTARKWIDERLVSFDVKELSIPYGITRTVCLFIPKMAEHQRNLLAASLGRIAFNGQMSGTTHELEVRGQIQTRGTFNDGPLLTDLRLEGGITDLKDYRMSVAGSIPALTYRGHSYEDLQIEGKTDGRNHELSFTADDPCLDLDLHAKLNHFGTARSCATLHADVRHFSPNALSLTEASNLEGLDFSFLTEAEIHGHRWAEMTGDLEIRDLRMQRDDTIDVSLAPIVVRRTMVEGEGVATVESPFLTMQYVTAEEHRLSGRMAPVAELLEAFHIDMEFQKPLDFAVALGKDLHPQSALIEINQVKLPQGILIATLDAQADASDPLSSLTTRLSADLISPKHKFSTALNAHIAQNMKEFYLGKGVISLDNVEFDMNGGQVTRSDSGYITFDHVTLQHDNQTIHAHGSFGQKESGISISLDSLEIRPLLAMTGKNYLDFGGLATGDILVSLQNKKPVISTENLQVDHFSYIGTEIGHSSFVAGFDLSKKLLQVDVRFLTAEHRHSHAEGWIQLAKRDSMDLHFDLERLPLDFISYWVGNVLQDLHGYGTGEVRLFGECKRPNISGHPFADLNFTHSFLGTRFHLNDIIHLDAQPQGDSHILLNQVALADDYGNTLRATADILHDHLSHFRYGVEIVIPQTPHGFLVYNHPRQENGALYWGQLFATGQALLQGGDGVHYMSVNMQTADRSTFFLSPGEEHPADDNSQYQLLTYRTSPLALPDSIDASTSTLEFEEHNPLNLNIDLNILANERCEVYVQLDPLADDHLICRGRGDIAIHYDPRSDMRVFGQYNMSNGSYTMTMSGDLFSKEFALMPTSTVRFSGPASQAELNWDCKYSIPSVNLTDLDQSFASLASMSRTTLPVDCKMKVTGPMSQPVVSFDLEVKNVSDDVQALIHNLIGTPEMLNQEVFYLLLFSRFYTPSYAQAQQNHTGSEISSFASSSITSQLNNLLGRMSDNFTLGTNFRSEKGDFTDMEMDVAISTRLFSNRLLLNGNFGYRDPSTRIGLNNNTNSFIGDFDAEYLINPTGTVRAKAYSHYNERDYSINNALTTQGLGIVLRRDFRSFMDLLRNKKR